MKYPIYDAIGNIKCYTQIDRDDYFRVSGHSWRLMGRGYIKGRIRGKDVYLHRFVMNERNPRILIDHSNNDILDNRKKNLRKATHTQNAFNRTKAKNTSSIYKGVCYDKHNKKWQSYYKVGGKKYLIGYFRDEKEAGSQYDAVVSKLFGKFALLNFPRKK